MAAYVTAGAHTCSASLCFIRGSGCAVLWRQNQVFAQALNSQTNSVFPFEKVLSCGRDRHENL